MTPRVLGRWTAEELGLPAPATIRCMLRLSNGDLALGSDYGMVLWRDGHMLPFPFPIGARREMRRVEALAEHDGVLHVATMKGRFTWPFRGEAAGKGLPLDGRGGFDDIRSLHARPDGLLVGWRTHLEGGKGPGDCLCFADFDGGVVAGTMDGRFVQVDGDEIRRFERDGKGRPIRYMAAAFGHVWLAAVEAHHRWDGGRWSSSEVEPYALHTDDAGRLWMLARGGLWVSEDGSWPRRLDVALDRPWALGSVPGELWVGRRGGLVRLGV
ncbi:MAG: hypothetical protein GY913_31165 [Proteobacteria bacterium]|nr:hypothetical protein [Pseudomonadota bacterium]MCP4921379.1 hypothetical protein [Pseudomonadota bacterium]